MKSVEGMMWCMVQVKKDGLQNASPLPTGFTARGCTATVLGAAQHGRNKYVIT